MTDKAKLYAVKNDEGEWLSFDSSHESVWDTNNPTFFKDKIYAEAQRMGRKVHVVELVESPAKIVVSEEEAEMLEQAKRDDDPAELIVGFVNSHDDYDDDRKAEDRLMRAYVIGWTVEKPKRYFVRVPHANRHYYYQKCDSGEVIPVWDMETEPPTQFTVAEIEHYELTDCERLEVTNDDK